MILRFRPSFYWLKKYPLSPAAIFEGYQKIVEFWKQTTAMILMIPNLMYNERRGAGILNLNFPTTWPFVRVFRSEFLLAESISPFLPPILNNI